MRLIRVLLVLLCLATAANAADTHSVLIRTGKPYDKMVKTIQQLGGNVTFQYKYVNALAADVPTSSLATLEKLVGAENIAKDEILSIPELNGRLNRPEQSDLADSVAAESETQPLDYPLTNTVSHVSSLQSAGFTGTGIVVAVIDSGYRPMFTHVAASRVLSGISFVPGEPNALDNNNFSHGSQVAGVLAANVGFCVASANHYAVAAAAYGAAFGPGNPNNLCGANTTIFMVGSAPLATIYPVKVFPFSGAGAPSSRTLAAMEHVLAKRQLWDSGDHVNGVNIKVLNMSLGGPTTYAGRTVNDEMVQQLLNADIVTVISAGNEGFSGITVGSPGTSMGALTVGAASLPVDERIVRAQFYAPCATISLAQVVPCANAWRPDNNIQIADFSSRGPTHDGRLKPDVVASGVFMFTQGSGTTAGTLNWVSGTSFSSPETAGIAAALRQAAPTATARQIRNAIIMTANPNLVPAGNVYEKGHGYVDATAALALLQTGAVPDTLALSTQYTRNLQANLSKAGIPVVTDSVTQDFTGIRPSQTADIAYMVPKNIGTLFVRVHDVTPGATQNIFFGDDVYIGIQGNKVHDDDYRKIDFVGAAGATYSFAKPEEGIWRITPMGDWTNAGPVNFEIDIWTTLEDSPQHTAKAKINQGDQHVYTVSVPPNTAELRLDVTWLNMSASYPINDIDVALIPPGSGTPLLDCATDKAPEACTVAKPAAGTWTVVVDGFSVIQDGTPGGRETYTIRVAADGVVLH
jgi:Subtilase family